MQLELKAQTQLHLERIARAVRTNVISLPVLYLHESGRVLRSELYELAVLHDGSSIAITRCRSRETNIRRVEHVEEIRGEDEVAFLVGEREVPLHRAVHVVI